MTKFTLFSLALYATSAFVEASTVSETAVEYNAHPVSVQAIPANLQIRFYENVAGGIYYSTANGVYQLEANPQGLYSRQVVSAEPSRPPLHVEACGLNCLLISNDGSVRRIQAGQVSELALPGSNSGSLERRSGFIRTLKVVGDNAYFVYNGLLLRYALSGATVEVVTDLQQALTPTNPVDLPLIALSISPYREGLLIGTVAHGIVYFDLRDGTFVHHAKRPEVTGGLPRGTNYKQFPTENGFLTSTSDGLYLYDEATKKFSKIGRENITGEVYSSARLDPNRIVLANNGRAMILDLRSKVVSPVLLKNAWGKPVRVDEVNVDGAGVLWVSADGRYFRAAPSLQGIYSYHETANAIYHEEGANEVRALGDGKGAVIFPRSVVLLSASERDGIALTHVLRNPTDHHFAGYSIDGDRIFFGNASEYFIYSSEGELLEQGSHSIDVGTSAASSVLTNEGLVLIASSRGIQCIRTKSASARCQPYLDSDAKNSWLPSRFQSDDKGELYIEYTNGVFAKLPDIETPVSLYEVSKAIPALANLRMANGTGPLLTEDGWHIYEKGKRVASLNSEQVRDVACAQYSSRLGKVMVAKTDGRIYSFDNDNGFGKALLQTESYGYSFTPGACSIIGEHFVVSTANTLVAVPLSTPIPVDPVAKTQLNFESGANDWQQPSSDLYVLPSSERSISVTANLVGIPAVAGATTRYIVNGQEIVARGTKLVINELKPGINFISAAIQMPYGADSTPINIKVSVTPYWYETIAGRIAVGVLCLILLGGLAVWLLHRRTATLLNREKQRSLQHLQEQSVAFADELTHLAHEIRSPIQSILVEVERLSDLAPSSVAQLTNQAELCLFVSQTMLDRYKVKNGRPLQSQCREESPTVLLETVRRISSNIMLRRKVDSVIEVVYEGGANFACDEALLLRLDARRLQQALIGLLSNSLKHNEGPVRCALGCTITRADTESLDVSFYVSDDGTGMPAEVLSFLNDQSERATTPAARDHGLGLTLIKELAKTIGGTVSAVNQELGSRVSISFTGVSYRRKTGNDEGPERITEGLTALLLDDTPEIALGVSRILRTNGYQSTIANSCEEFLELVQTHRYSVVLVDLNLHDGASGLALLERCSDSLRHSKVVIMSAQDFVEVRSTPDLSFSFIAKPFTSKELLEVLRKEPVN